MPIPFTLPAAPPPDVPPAAPPVTPPAPGGGGGNWPAWMGPELRQLLSFLGGYRGGSIPPSGVGRAPAGRVGFWGQPLPAETAPAPAPVPSPPVGGGHPFASWWPEGWQQRPRRPEDEQAHIMGGGGRFGGGGGGFGGAAGSAAGVSSGASSGYAGSPSWSSLFSFLGGR